MLAFPRLRSLSWFQLVARVCEPQTWRAQGFQRYLPWGVLLCLLGVGLSLAGQWQAAGALARGQVEVDAAAAALQQVAQWPADGGGNPTTQGEADFAQRLPPVVDTAQVLRRLQQETVLRGVALVSATISSKSPSPHVAGRTDLALMLRGDYAGLKLVLAGLTERQDGMVLQRLSLRRLGSPSELEARVDMTLLSRPLAAPPEGG